LNRWAGPHSKLREKTIKPDARGPIGRAEPIESLSNVGICSKNNFLTDVIRVFVARGMDPRFPTVEFLELEHGCFHRVPKPTKITAAKVNLDFTINVAIFRNPISVPANSAWFASVTIPAR
jgi:hypothetical protein